jgi:predicted metal-dependent hydrolase
VRSFTYGSLVIPYSLERAPRRTLAITVHPDLAVHVRAPLDTDDAAVERVLRRRVLWIVRQQRFFARFLPRTPERRYISGETHLYLGRQYQLRVRPAEDQEQAKLAGAFLYVFAQEPTAGEKVKSLLQRWYVARAQVRFPERLSACMQSAVGRNIATPELRIRRMTKRWGSCSASGTLTLNVDLIRAPQACIDYVIVHELCHLHNPNHSPAFYQLLCNVMPDWETRKFRLEKLLS